MSKELVIGIIMIVLFSLSILVSVIVFILERIEQRGKRSQNENETKRDNPNDENEVL